MFVNHPRSKTVWAVFAVGVAGVCCLPALAGPLDKGLEVNAYWEPFKESKYNFGRDWEELRDLKPAEAVKVYQATDFQVFLPPKDAALGDVWKLQGQRLLPFLRQFHKGASLKLHHGPAAQGAFACLRARDDRYDEIIFRIHAEFSMSDGKSYYTPAQFAGQLLFDRSAALVKYFRFYLPPRNTNVDVNRFVPGKVVAGKQQESVISADIGYAPRMELVGGDAELAKKIEWKTSISLAESALKLAQRFYKFSEIRWLPWDEAVAQSKRTGKPLHVVVLFGTLDDESC